MIFGWLELLMMGLHGARFSHLLGTSSSRNLTRGPGGSQFFVEQSCNEFAGLALLEADQTLAVFSGAFMFGKLLRGRGGRPNTSLKDSRTRRDRRFAPRLEILEERVVMSAGAVTDYT